MSLLDDLIQKDTERRFLTKAQRRAVISAHSALEAQKLQDPDDARDYQDLLERCGHLVNKVAELERRITAAAESASETHPSWERRCYAILHALGLDFGEPTPDLPEQSGWYARNVAQLQRQLEVARDERDLYKRVLHGIQDAIAIALRPRERFSAPETPAESQEQIQQVVARRGSILRAMAEDDTTKENP